MLSLETLLTVVLPLAVAATAVGSVAVVRRLHRTDRRWGDVARSRLVMGVPWGSLVVMGFVLWVYLFVQDGIADFHNPVVIPFRAYSYFYPLGMLTSSFSHAGSSHLLGNLSGAAIVAPIAEYAWGHYPDGRGEGSFSSWRTNPWLRALVGFPLAVIGVGILSSVFALGPVIGFSGVVFAFAAFALVHYPIVTLVGLLGVQSAILTVYRALQTPIGVYVAEPRPPTAPSWAGIAIQGHALGFFIGFVLAVALLRRRGHRPDALRLWLAVLLFAFAKGLWQIYWFVGENAYVLFQGPGVLVVAALAVVVTAAVVASDRPLVPARLERRLPAIGRSADSPVDRPLEGVGDGGERATGGRLERIRELASNGVDPRSGGLSGATPRGTAFVAVLLVFAIIAGVAIPVNCFVYGDAESSDAAVEVEDYTIEYAEGVENELASPVQIGPFAEVASIESSGVIVTSEERHVWSEVVPAHTLAYTGDAEIAVGGPGWRETVHVERTGWEPVGNDTVYRVEIRAEGEEPQLAHESNASRADVRIDERNVTVASRDGEFVLEVSSPEIETDETTIPGPAAPTMAGGLTFERSGETIYAVTDSTRVAVASEETYD